MPRTKNARPKATPPPAAAAAPAAGRTVASRSKAKPSTALTHERIADDLVAFRKAGGKIEVLGVTRLLTRIDSEGPAAPASPRATAASAKSRR